MRKIFGFFLGFISLACFAESPLTVQRDLVFPYSYWEHLYFDTDSANFLGVKYLTDPEKAFAPSKERGYSFKLVQSLPKKTKLVRGTTLFLFEGKDTRRYLSHFFHLLEHIVGFWSCYGDRFFEDVRLIVIAGDGDIKNQYVWEGPNEINRHLLQALFPHAAVKHWTEFLDDYRGKTLQFDRAVTCDRALANRSDACRKINKLLGAAQPTIEREQMERLAERVHVYAKSELKNRTDLNVHVTYLKRPTPRTLSEELEKAFIEDLEKMGNVTLTKVDFATLAFDKQIQIIRNTDVLISVHGNGLSHILFLPQGAKVIEIFPPDAHALDYRLFADVRGIDYLGVIAERGVIEREEAYQRGAFGNVNVGISKLDFAPIEMKIRGF